MARKETYLTCSDNNVFEGMTSISAIIQNLEKNSDNARQIMRILVDRTRARAKERELTFLQSKSKKLGFEILLVDSEDIEKRTTGNTHGGIIAECETKKLKSLSENIQKILADGIYVMLDGVEDPYNFGYSLRSLYAAGVTGVVLAPRNWMDVAGIVAKSSAGASELLDMYIAEPLEAIDLFKSKGYTVICSGIRNSVSMYDANMKKPVFLIVGGEKRGVSSAIEEQADIVARIEYGRKFRGSLSTASAATIMVYEIYRQNR